MPRLHRSLNLTALPEATMECTYVNQVASIFDSFYLLNIFVIFNSRYLVQHSSERKYFICVKYMLDQSRLLDFIHFLWNWFHLLIEKIVNNQLDTITDIPTNLSIWYFFWSCVSEWVVIHYTKKSKVSQWSVVQIHYPML